MKDERVSRHVVQPFLQGGGGGGGGGGVEQEGYEALNRSPEYTD